MTETDFQAVTQVQQKVWSNGDFARVASVMQIVGERLAETADVMPGEKVLDVATGSGNIAIAAARRFADTTGLDYVPSLLETAKMRAEAEGFPEIEWVEGDAQALPFEDASFDVVLSAFGVMFAPDQPKAAAELLRVTRPGGRIGLCNWTPEGAVGEMFKITSTHAPPPFKIDPPVLWGTEERLRELLGDGIASLEIKREHMNMKGRSGPEYLEWFRTWFGPMKTAYERLGEDGFKPLADDFLAAFERRNTAGDRGLRVPSEYLEVIAVRA
jgi:ubiquinone/menaquinone biosynthesis C-methylase UbiE